MRAPPRPCSAFDRAPCKNATPCPQPLRHRPQGRPRAGAAPPDLLLPRGVRVDHRLPVGGPRGGAGRAAAQNGRLGAAPRAPAQSFGRRTGPVIELRQAPRSAERQKPDPSAHCAGTGGANALPARAAAASPARPPAPAGHPPPQPRPAAHLRRPRGAGVHRPLHGSEGHGAVQSLRG